MFFLSGFQFVYFNQLTGPIPVVKALQSMSQWKSSSVQGLARRILKFPMRPSSHIKTPVTVEYER
jgi:hypothetical protein